MRAMVRHVGEQLGLKFERARPRRTAGDRLGSAADTELKEPELEVTIGGDRHAPPPHAARKNVVAQAPILPGSIPRRTTCCFPIGPVSSFLLETQIETL